jgi:hypothetical protein
MHMSGIDNKDGEGEFARTPDLAHLVIDAHRAFNDPAYEKGFGTEETLAAAGKVGSLCDAFRKASVPNYFVHLPRLYSPVRNHGGFMPQPGEGDIKICKWRDSAFSSGFIGRRLDRAGLRTLVISGFNQSACVLFTAEGALKKGYKVWIVNDAVANDKRFVWSEEKAKKTGLGSYAEWAMNRLVKAGARLTTADAVIRALTR